VPAELVRPGKPIVSRTTDEPTGKVGTGKPHELRPPDPDRSGPEWDFHLSV